MQPSVMCPYNYLGYMVQCYVACNFRCHVCGMRYVGNEIKLTPHDWISARFSNPSMTPLLARSAHHYTPLLGKIRFPHINMIATSCSQMNFVWFRCAKFIWQVRLRVSGPGEFAQSANQLKHLRTVHSSELGAHIICSQSPMG